MLKPHEIEGMRELIHQLRDSIKDEVRMPSVGEPINAAVCMFWATDNALLAASNALSALALLK